MKYLVLGFGRFGEGWVILWQGEVEANGFYMASHLAREGERSTWLVRTVNREPSMMGGEYRFDLIATSDRTGVTRTMGAN